MDPFELQNAALLAAGSPGGAALSPKKAGLGTAWLDLRDASPQVALRRAAEVAHVLSACLSLQDDAYLLVSVEGPAHQAVVSTMSSAFQESGWPELPIAVVRGEDVLGGLEEFLVAGCVLRNEEPPHQTLREESRSPVAALAQVPPTTLHDAWEAGAKVIVSQTADQAGLNAAFGTTPVATDQGPVTLWFANRLTATVLFQDDRPTDDLGSELRNALPEGVKADVDQARGEKLLWLSARHEETFNEACRRCELLLDGLPTRLDKLQTRVYDKWKTHVPAELLEFGFDLRAAREWSGG